MLLAQTRHQPERGVRRAALASPVVDALSPTRTIASSSSLDNGFYVEAISLAEVQSDLDVGFTPDQVILDGPSK
jgi:hypothetical protein